MKRDILIAVTALVLASLACETATPAPGKPTPTPEEPIAGIESTVYGFFPTPVDVTVEGVLATMKAIGEHADVALFQQEIPWTDFSNTPDANSEKLEDLRGMVNLAKGNGLEPIFVVDPLDGLNRRVFYGLPEEMADGDFATTEIRQAFKHYSIRLVREFQPRYLGLASEINTYMDAHPADVENYLSLYRETYDAIKKEAPDTQIFVTFQWDDLNNLGVFNEGSEYATKWQQIEAFEPQLDLWVISSYPCFFFDQAAAIPLDYYTPLLARTGKPIAVAEGGCSSKEIEIHHGSLQDQVHYLHAIDDQLGGVRLAFWIYLLYNDLNMDSFAPLMRKQGSDDRIESLSFFASIGLVETNGVPKPALAIWDRIRNNR